MEGPIDAVKTPDDIKATPYKLPPSFMWSDIDIMDEKDATSNRFNLSIGR